MAVVSALVFIGALAMVAFVFAATVIPALPRIVEALAGGIAPQPRLVLARHRSVVRPHPQAARLARRLSEAA